MSAAQEQPLKAVVLSRSVDAQEWAIRQGMSIASRHCGTGIKASEKRFALAADIAEALQNIRNACNQGLM